MNNSLLWCYLLLAGFADSPCDLVTCIDADAYFQARHIAVTAERLQDRAAEEPADNAGQLARLLAIRWLGEHRVRAAGGTLWLLARGPVASDPHGFAQEYAARALARLDGKPFGRGPTRANWLREGLQWFPENVTCVAALDLTVAWANKPLVLKGWGGLAPGRATGPDLVLGPALLARDDPEPLYRGVERFGNMALDRVAVAQLAPVQPGATGAAAARLTGRWDHRALVGYLRQVMGLSLAGWEQRRGGEAITFLRDDERQLAVAVIGDSDLVVAAMPGAPGEGEAALERILEVRSGRQADVLRGPARADLEAVPGNTSALLVGELPEEMRSSLAKDLETPSFPHRVVLHVIVNQSADLDVRFRGLLRTPGEARSLAEDVRRRRDSATAFLAKLRSDQASEAPAPLIRTLDSIRVEADGATIRGEAHISGDVPDALAELVPLLLGQALEGLGNAVFRAVLVVVCVFFVAAGLFVVGGVVVLLACLAAAARRQGSPSTP
jgi:hypothetical protein